MTFMRGESDFKIVDLVNRTHNYMSQKIPKSCHLRTALLYRGVFSVKHVM